MGDTFQTSSHIHGMILRADIFLQLWCLTLPEINILLMEEIRRSPVEVGSLPRYLQGFIHSKWLFGISGCHQQ